MKREQDEIFDVQELCDIADCDLAEIKHNPQQARFDAMRVYHARQVIAAMEDIVKHYAPEARG